MEFGLFLPFHWFGKAASVRNLYDDQLELAVTADELGYDTAWIAEHHLIDFIGCPSPFVFAPLVAERTRQIRIGTAVAVLPFYHPLRFLGDAAVADVVTNGRMELGLGRGAFPFEQLAYNLGIDDSKEAFQEGVDVMLRMWRGEHAISHKGRFWSFDDARVVPDPLQKPHPPIWIAGQTAPTMEWAVKNKMNVLNTPWRDSFQRVVDVYNVYKAARDKYGVTHEESKLGLSRMCFVGETEEEVRRQLPMVRFNQDQLLHLHNGTAKVIDGKVQHEIAVDKATGEKHVESGRFGWGGATAAFSDDDLYNNLIFGTPAQVREKIAQYVDLGVDHLILYMPFGPAHQDVLKSLRLFGTEVLPHFKKQPAVSGARS